MLNRRASAGFTLVEVMVTVFVVAIGLLAAAALQAVAKKAAVDAVQRTTASVLAQDILERMRSNPAQITAYAAQGSELKTAPSATDCGSGPCTAEQLVSYDLAEWVQGLEGAAETIQENGSNVVSGGLRSPVGCIRQSGVDAVEIVIAWRGMTAITPADEDDADDPTGDACGKDEADFADPTAGSSQSFRRVLRLQAHIRT